jgi:hypothetical protein
MNVFQVILLLKVPAMTAVSSHGLPHLPYHYDHHFPSLVQAPMYPYYLPTPTTPSNSLHSNHHKPVHLDQTHLPPYHADKQRGAKQQTYSNANIYQDKFQHTRNHQAENHVK